MIAACSKPDRVPDKDGDDENTEDTLPKDLPTDLRKPIVSVKKTGAVGDGLTDDTKAIQQAIDQLAANGGGTVYVPPGVYAINAKKSIQLKSKVDMYMRDTLTELAAIPNDTTSYTVIMIADAMDVRLRGGKVKGERAQHTGTRGEWGMGVGVHGSANIFISDIVISDCWGDGIYISDNKSKTRGSAFVRVKNVISRNNRRQGLSIIKAAVVIIEDCKFMYTNGTAPQAGIDIEPNYDTASHISIVNTECAYNMGAGIMTYERKAPPLTVVTNIEIHNNYLHHNNTYGGILSGGRNINFTNNRIVANRYTNPMVWAKDTVNCILSSNQSDQDN